MKKHLFILLAVAVLVSCSDMVTEDPLAADLPKDFEVSVYSQINPDVAISQLVASIKTFTYPSGNVGDNACKAEFGNNLALFEKVYVEYIGCPRKAWNDRKPCEGQEAFKGWNNPTYQIDSAGGTWCRIPGCLSTGWDELPCNGYEECVDMGFTGEIQTLKEQLEDGSFQRKQVWNTPTWQSICYSFYAYEQNMEEYLDNYKYDSTLIAKHFTMSGRYEGRPYKYCDSDETEIRSSDMAVVWNRGVASGDFYDYSANLFCLKQSDGKVYKIK